MKKPNYKEDFEALVKDYLCLRACALLSIGSMSVQRFRVKELQDALDRASFRVEQRFGPGGDLLVRKKRI